MLTWSDPIMIFGYLGFALLFLALTLWNPVGDYIAILFALRADPLPANALIAPAVQNYLSAAGNQGLLSDLKCKVFYTQSTVPYLLPLGKNRIVLSLGLEDWLLQNPDSLFRAVPREAYEPKLILSRKALLISVVCYIAVIRFMELWAIFFAVAIKAITALAMMIATGAFFEGVREMVNATLWGFALGIIIMKINEWVNYVQDKFVNWIMDSLMKSSVQMLEHEVVCLDR